MFRFIFAAAKIHKKNDTCKYCVIFSTFLCIFCRPIPNRSPHAHARSLIYTPYTVHPKRRRHLNSRQAIHCAYALNAVRHLNSRQAIHCACAYTRVARRKPQPASSTAIPHRQAGTGYLDSPDPDHLPNLRLPLLSSHEQVRSSH